MRGTSVRVAITREVKRFTTPVACRLGQARVREKEREIEEKKKKERKLATRGDRREFV